MKQSLSLILLDRDGTLTVEDPSGGYVLLPNDLKLIEGAAEAVEKLNQAGLNVALVTNQSPVGRGIITETELEAIHISLKEKLAASGAHLDRLYVCTDPPDQPTPRRKPGPGMLIEAMADFDVSPEETLMIGDDLRDLQAAMTAGCRAMLVRTGKGQKVSEVLQDDPDLADLPVAADLAVAVELILKQGDVHAA